MNADRYTASAGPSDPGSWNRYSYVQGDPVNFTDRRGLFRSIKEIIDVSDETGDEGGIADFWFFFGGGLDDGGGGRGGGGCDGNGGGGGTLSNSDLIPTALKQAIADLAKADCASVFSGGLAHGHDPANVLNQIISGTQCGSVVFKDLGPGSGADEYAPFHLPWQKKSVVIEINSFNNPALGIYWNAGDVSVNAITLLHELGHAFNDLFGKGSSTIENDVTRLVKINQAAEDRNAARLEPCAK